MTDAEHSSEPKELQASADAAAGHVQGVHLTFVLFNTYLCLAVASTTDEQLFRAARLNLPLLNVGLSVVLFYFVAPFLLLLLHFNLLLQLYLLSCKLHALEEALGRSKEEQRGSFRTLLYPLAFSHAVAGSQHRRLMRAFLRVDVWATVILLPLSSLLWTQIWFLPYHHGAITSWHQAAVGVDLLLLWTFWPIVTDQNSRWFVRIRSAPIAVLGALAGSLLLLFFARHPLDALNNLSSWVNCSRSLQGAILRLATHNNLHLPGRTLVLEAPPAEIIALYLQRNSTVEQAWYEHAKGLDLKGRDFGSAELSQTRLMNSDLQNATLDGAILESAQLQGVDLRGAHLKGADLRWANLQGANLEKAELQGANLEGAQLEGTILGEAMLQGGILTKAQLEGADLSQATLLGADLKQADLRSTELNVAHLHGANLQGAQLQGADLMDAQLHGANLRNTYLSGASLDRSDLGLADFREADLAPLSRREYDDLAATVALAVTGKPWADKALKHLKRLSAEKPIELSSQGAKVGMTMHSGQGPFATWEDPPAEAIYRQALTDYLANLACDGASIANGIARRVLSLSDAGLARALLLKDCESVRKLPDPLRNEVERIAHLG